MLVVLKSSPPSNKKIKSHILGSKIIQNYGILPHAVMPPQSIAAPHPALSALNQANESCNQVISHPRAPYMTNWLESHMQGVISLSRRGTGAVCCRWDPPLPCTHGVAQTLSFIPKLLPLHKPTLCTCLLMCISVPHATVGPLALSIRPFCVETEAEKNCWLWGQRQENAKKVQADGSGGR